MDAVNNDDPALEYEDDDLWEIVYVSTAPFLLSDEELEKLLEISGRKNPPAGITGILLYQDGNFMQLIEGPKAAAEELYEKIQKDPLHHGIITLLRQPLEERSFAKWAMKFRDISKLTLDEQLGAAPYYDGSLGSDEYIREPNRSLLLLRSFIDNSRS